jgi:hypothetical protein
LRPDADGPMPRPPRRDGPTRRRLAVFAALFVSVLLGTGAAVPLFDDPIEYKVKAAFLYNFARYVTWPDEAFVDKDGDRSPLVFGVLGEDPFGAVLDATVGDKTIAGRETAVRRLKQDKEALDCHILFVSQSEAKRVDKITGLVGKSPVFCVSEIDDYAVRGGVSRFIIRLGTTAFEINKDLAEERGLSVSSQLLKLATVVESHPKYDKAGDEEEEGK